MSLRQTNVYAVIAEWGGAFPKCGLPSNGTRTGEKKTVDFTVRYIPYLAKVAARLNPCNIKNPC